MVYDVKIKDNIFISPEGTDSLNYGIVFENSDEITLQTENNIFIGKINKEVIVGKGNKERNVYLNAGCLTAIDDYLKERNAIVSPSVEPALFISSIAFFVLSSVFVVNTTITFVNIKGFSYNI